MPRLEQLLKLTETADSHTLRFAIGHEYLKLEQFDNAVAAFAKAVEMEPDFSAGWKFYGKALAQTGRTDEARQAYRQGIEAAERHGDVQAAREMRVFLKRLDK